MSDSEEYCNSDDTDDGIDINDEIVDVNDEISEDSEYEDEIAYREIINNNLNVNSYEFTEVEKKEKKIRIRKDKKEKKFINYLEKKDDNNGKKFLKNIKNRKSYKKLFNPRLPPLENCQSNLKNKNYKNNSSIDINDKN